MREKEGNGSGWGICKIFEGDVMIFYTERGVCIGGVDDPIEWRCIFNHLNIRLTQVYGVIVH